MNRFFISFILSLLFCVNTAYSQVPPTSVFFSNSGKSHWLTYQGNHRALYRLITDEVFKQLDERTERISGLSTEREWLDYQNHLKKSFYKSLDNFEKTPLNARTTGILERETFTVEKVVFESHPGFYVTAGLFIPKKRQHPAPAVIYACGHTDLGFRSETYQHVIMNLVSKGFIVLGFDPIGQGERMQYPDPATGKSKIGGPTIEHSYAGSQTLLKGVAITDYFIWDGIRVVDYLETRKEVDMSRIGITGRSGGGTQTAQIAACDERIYAAAPENYITSFKRLLQAIGPQDAEQNPYRFVHKGFDHADYLHIRAPKPALIITTSNDYFSIQGARETYAEVKRSYAAMGKQGNIRMTEDLGSHQSTKNNREALYAFYQKHLNLPGDSTDNETTPFSLEELQVTPTGQVVTSYNSKTVFNLNQNYTPATPKTGIEEQVTQIAGISFDRKLKSAVFTGNYVSEELVVKRYFLENNRNDYALPLYLIEGKKNEKEAIIVWLHYEGKTELLSDPLLPEMLEAGYTVIGADLPGIGELKDPDFSGDGIVKGVPFNYVFGANLAAKSIPGIMAEAIDLVDQFIKNDKNLQQKKLYAVVNGPAASAFLHYAVLNDTFKKAAFIDFPGSSAHLLTNEYYNPAIAYTLPPGSLIHYDLPDLAKHLSFLGMGIHYAKSGERTFIDFLNK
jgi:cephalosporin-C deacetylase-like acetyl esterase